MRLATRLGSNSLNNLVQCLSDDAQGAGKECDALPVLDNLVECRVLSSDYRVEQGNQLSGVDVSHVAQCVWRNVGEMLEKCWRNVGEMLERMLSSIVLM